MVNQLAVVFCRVAQVLVSCAVLMSAAAPGPAQTGLQFPPLPSDFHEEPKVFDPYPQNPSLPPAYTIPVGPLGFSAPGPFYLLHRYALVSLDFLDENRLLFTFRKPGLMRRDAADDMGDKDRQIRAVVVALPEGKIESEALWTVPDEARYLWMLKDGHFLLRDSDGLEQGDATLKTTPNLRLPGRLLWVELDVAQKVMITNSLEPGSGQGSGEASSPAAGQTATTGDAKKPDALQTLVVRTLKRESGEVIKTMRVPWDAQTRDWPVNADGYVESVRGSAAQWTLKLNLFAGGSREVGQVESNCQPSTAFVTETELLVSTCAVGGGGRLTALSTANGAQLWRVTTATNAMLPLVVAAPDGSLLARETLLLKHPAAHYRHKKLVGAEDLIGQVVRVMDAADGKVVLEAPLTPMLDGGGNVAISPLGRRVAILNGGAIEVFELPAARAP